MKYNYLYKFIIVIFFGFVSLFWFVFPGFCFCMSDNQTYLNTFMQISLTSSSPPPTKIHASLLNWLTALEKRKKSSLNYFKWTAPSSSPLRPPCLFDAAISSTPQTPPPLNIVIFSLPLFFSFPVAYSTCWNFFQRNKKNQCEKNYSTTGARAALFIGVALETRLGRSRSGRLSFNSRVSFYRAKWRTKHM